MRCECRETRSVIQRSDGAFICCLCGWPMVNKLEEVDLIRSPFDEGKDE